MLRQDFVHALARSLDAAGRFDDADEILEDGERLEVLLNQEKISKHINLWEILFNLRLNIFLSQLH